MKKCCNFAPIIAISLTMALNAQTEKMVVTDNETLVSNTIILNRDFQDYISNVLSRGTGGIITGSKTLEANISIATNVDNGKAGIAIKSELPYSSTIITLPESGTTVSKIEGNGDGINAYGIHSVGSAMFMGGGKTLVFQDVLATKGNAIGIQAESLSFMQGINVVFEKISSQGGSAIGVNGVSRGGQGQLMIDFALSNGAQINFKNISSTNNAYGVYLNQSIALMLTGGSSLVFDSVFSSNHAYGIYVENNEKNTLALNGSGDGAKEITFKSITASANAVGLYSAGKLSMDGLALTFASVSSSANLWKTIGISASDLALSNGTSLSFTSISQKATGAPNTPAGVYGIYSDSRVQGLVLKLEGKSSIKFDSIEAAGQDILAQGITTGSGAQSTISTKNGTLSFGTISAQGNAGGIIFQTTASDFDGDITFAQIISSNGSAIGLGFALNASATFKEGSKVYIGSMSSSAIHTTYPIHARNANSLMFEKNAGLFYGVTSSPNDHAYGIYAKIDRTLSFMFGSGEKAEGVTSAIGTTFKSVSTDQAKNAYGFYLSVDQKKQQAYELKINGKAMFEQIQATSNHAYGIYVENNEKNTLALNGSGDGAKEITFKSIAASANAVGIGVVEKGKVKIGESLRLNFENISTQEGENVGKSYAIKNDGTLVLAQAGLLNFGIPDNNVQEFKRSGIYNAQDGLSYAFGITKIEGKMGGVDHNELQPIELDYGFYSTAKSVSFSGNFEVNNFQTSGTSFFVIKNVSMSASTFHLNNFTLTAYGNQTADKFIGFDGGSKGLNISLNPTNTLTINLMNGDRIHNIYEASKIPKSEGVAFGENVSLILGNRAKVIFNANGGKLMSLSQMDGVKNGILILSGERPEIFRNSKEYTNRIWTTIIQDSPLSFAETASQPKTTRNFNARHLSIENLKTQGVTFVLYADKNAKVVNMNESIYGKAYQKSVTAKINRIDLGGSDSIHVGSTSGDPIDNTLRIALGGLNDKNQKEVQNVILASVGKNSRDKVSFNGLKTSGDSVKTESYIGFDIAELIIKRQDLSIEDQKNGFENIGSIYYSDLVAREIAINNQYFAPIFNSLNVNFFALSANLNSLSKRLGDLKKDSNSHGVWARVFGGEQVSNFGIKTLQNYVTAQVGYDYGFDLSDAKNYLGGALTYSYGSSRQDEAKYIGSNGFETYQNSATTHEIEIALYNTYKENDGLYSDSIVKFAYLISNVDFYRNYNISTHSNIAVALSEEVGYEFSLGDNKEWMITPQVEVAYAFMNRSEFAQTQMGGSLSAISDALHLLRMRAGVNWGYHFNNIPNANKIKTLLYIGTYYEQDVISGGDMKFISSNHGNTVNYNDLTSNGRFVLNLGTDMQVQESTRIYIDFEKSFGTSLQKEYQVNFGMRYAFGEKKQEIEKNGDKAPLKLEEQDKENKMEDIESSEEVKESESIQEAQKSEERGA